MVSNDTSENSAQTAILNKILERLQIIENSQSILQNGITQLNKKNIKRVDEIKKLAAMKTL